MKLLLDLGNSRLKWGVVTAGAFVLTGEATHRDRDLGAALESLLVHPLAPEEIRIANVAGRAMGESVRAAVWARYGVQPVFARSPASASGLRNGYRDPAQLGVDRWLAMCAARSIFPGALCVVDAGTATTLDIVAADGTHRGGLILPGIGLMQSVLRRETGDLDRLAAVEPATTVPSPTPASHPPGQEELGTDTASGLRLGAIRSTACLIDACMEALTREPGGARLVLTGGDAPMLSSLVRARVELRPRLILEGLALEPACFASG